MNLIYLAARLVRHFLPESVTRGLLRRNVVIKPGLETREPAMAAARYQQVLLEHGLDIRGKHVLVFGYGGRYAIGVELLRLGARRVTLTDLFAPPDDRRNDHLLPEFSDYLHQKEGVVAPRGEQLSLVHGDIRQLAAQAAGGEFDGVVSTSVYEHLDDVEGITSGLSHLLKPGGFFIAYIDMRDHFFKYPFEMLTFTEVIWRRWLNPTSNLNRKRYSDYRRIIGSHFPLTSWRIMESNLPEFQKNRNRIRAEFKSGDDELDSVTQAMVFAIK